MTEDRGLAGRITWGRCLKLGYEYAAFYGFLLALGAVFLIWSPTGAVLSRILPARVATPLGQTVIRGAFRSFVVLAEVLGLMRCDLHALAALRDERGLVVAPNHPSLLDILLIGSCLPRAVCITKAELWNNPLLGGGARMAGYIPNDAPLRLVRRAAAEVRGGANLLVFPEGTRTVGGVPVSPFKPGFALIARHAEAPVQTLFIETRASYLRKGWPILRKPAFPLVYRVRLGPRVRVKGRAEDFACKLEGIYKTELAKSGEPV